VRRSVFVDEAAQLLGVSRRTVYYRIRAGRLRTIRTACGTRRVLIESIEALLREEVTARRTPASGSECRPAPLDPAVTSSASSC